MQCQWISEMKVSYAITTLKKKKKSTRCNELIEILQKLGFIVRDGRRGGHKLYIHSNLKEFLGGSFNCDHGKNPQIKPVYVQRVIKTLEDFEGELSSLGELKND